MGHGEPLEAAVVREVLEESGVAARVVRKLGVHDYHAPDGRVHRSHFFELRAEAGGPDAWSHDVGGDGEDRGFVFLCRWEALRAGLALVGEQDVFLGRLLESGGPGARVS